MTTQELSKIASEMGIPAIIKTLRKKEAQISKEKGKERATELVEEFIALMLKTNFSFNTNVAVWLIKIVFCPLVKGNGFKAN
jgi:hypothetical protein